MALPKKRLIKEKKTTKIDDKLRKTKKWQKYYQTLRPRNEKGELIPFRKVGSKGSGQTEEEFMAYIDFLVKNPINKKSPIKSFDTFYTKFKESRGSR